MSDRDIAISRSAVRRLLVAAVLVLVLSAAGIAYAQRDRFAPQPALAGQIDRTTYQAVFLVTSQVYFGRLVVLSPELYQLFDVFYVQTAPEGDKPGQLIKRGKELHGPMDPMLIPAREVLYVENMRPDSDVVIAIAKYKAGGGQPVPAGTPLPPQPATPRPSPTR